MNETMNTKTETREMNRNDIARDLKNMYPETVKADELYNKAREIEYKGDKGSMYHPIWLIVICMPFGGAGLLLLLSNLYYKKKHDKYYAKAAVVRQEADEIINSIESMIPVKYRFSAAVEYGYELCETGRINSLPELYDRLDEQMHRWNLENQNDVLIQNQRETNARLGRVEANTTVSAVSNVFSAIGSFIR